MRLKINFQDFLFHEVAKCDRESINIVRFIATMAIFNHLAAPFYGSYSFLSTGGGYWMCFVFLLFWVFPFVRSV